MTAPSTAASAAYLRALTAGGGHRAAAHDQGVVVPVPIRLLDRLGADAPAHLAAIDDAELEQALRWERAAVLAGRTMSEWALLGLAAAGAAPKPSGSATTAADAADRVDG